MVDDTRATKAEIKQIKADRGYWQGVGDPAGWKLHGWTYRNVASFLAPRDGQQGAIVEITQDHINLIAAHVAASKLQTVIDNIEERPQPISLRKQYTTRSGDPVIVYAVNKGGTHPVHVGTPLPNGKQQFGKRTRYGQVHEGQVSDRDLVIKRLK